MTWGITETKQPRPAQGPDIAPPTNWQGVGAAVEKTWQESDVAMQRARQVNNEKNRLALDIMGRLGPEAIEAEKARLNSEAESKGGFRISAGGLSNEELLNLGRQEAIKNPEAWADIDLSQETIEAEITKRRAEENRVNQELLSLSPNPGFNALVGGVAAAVVDPVNIALTPFGAGAGSLWRIMLAEGGLGALSEAIQYPTRKKVADELGLEDPNLVESMTYGALGGAVFGGAIAGVPRVIRAVRYARELNKLAKTNGYDDIGAEGAVRAAEDAIDMDKNPLDAVAEALKATPERQFREPLLLTDAQRVADPMMLTPDQRVTAVTPEPTPLAPDPITTESLPPAEGFTPTTPGETAAMAEAAIDAVAPKAPKQPKGPRKPKPTDLSTFIVREGGIWKGNDAGELADMEYKRPGFLRAKQFEISAAGNNGGGRLIEDMRQRAVDAGYLRSDETISDFLEAIRNDATGTNKRYAQGEAPDTPEEYFSPDYMRDYDPVDEFLNGGPSPFGFYVPKDPLTEDVIWDFNIERDFDDYLEASWQSASFSRDEIAEMKHYMQTIGGEAEDLVMSVFNRRTRFAEMDPKEAWKYDTGQQYEPDLEASFRTVSEDAGLAGSGGGRVDGPNPDAEAAPGGGTGAGRDYGVEATPAGQQAFIPGSRESDVAARQAEIAKRDAEVKMLQSKQRRLNQVRVEDSVDGLFAQRTVDLFDDMMSPEAQAAMDVEVNAMRTDTSDLEVSTVADDGRSLGSLGDVLNEIDEMDDLVREFDLCRTGGGAE